MALNLAFVGTYTDPALQQGRELAPGEAVMGMTGPTGAEGIYVYRRDPASGAMSLLHAEAADNPSFLILDPEERFLFAVNELGGSDAGRVTSFALNRNSGRLQAINQVPTGGGVPCHLSMSSDGRSLLIANYETGSVSVVPVDQDGRLSPPIDVHSDAADQRERTRAHYITPDPTGRFVLATNVGTDRVTVYFHDTATGKLLRADPPGAATHFGGSPRHLGFSPSGRYVFVNGEADLTLSAFRFDPDSGRLDYVGHVSTVPPGPSTEGNSTAQMLVHPSGRFVFVANRGYNSIATVRWDEATETMEFAGTEPSLGDTPRNFQLDPTGSWLYVANQNSGTIERFAIDLDSGALAHDRRVAAVPAPVCIQFSRT